MTNSRPVVNATVVVMALMFCLLMASSSFAAKHQNHEKLRHIAKSFLTDQLSTKPMHESSEVRIGHLDSRLRITPCQQAPEPFLSPGSKLQGKLTVGLRCNKPRPWTVYLSAHIQNYGDVLTAAHALTRGTKITEADIISSRLELNGLRYGYFTQKKNVIGKILKRPINAGQAFLPKRLKTPLLVRRGDQVTIIALTNGLQVRVKGEALRDAALGEKLPVRNSRSKRIIQAVATKAGTVTINM